MALMTFSFKYNIDSDYINIFSYLVSLFLLVHFQVEAPLPLCVCVSIRESQTKISLIFHLTPAKIVVTKSNRQQMPPRRDAGEYR